MIDSKCLHALGALVSKLQVQPVLSEDTVESRRLQHRQSIKAKIQHGLIPDANLGTLPHLNRPDAQQYLKQIKNDLCAQVQITDRMLDDWNRVGEYPAPGYPSRICVILRKAKLYDLEFEFLSAYCRHFNSKASAGDKLTERARKIGAYP